MNLREPAPTRGDLRFSIGPVPVRVNPLFWVVTVALGLVPGATVATTALWVLAVFVSILVHELGHALTARAQGASAHIVLYGLGGLAIHRPVRRDTWSRIAVAAAGPGAGFVLGGLVAAIVLLSGYRVEILGLRLGDGVSLLGGLRAERFAHDLLFVNIAWGLFNLLPIHPLDGGTIARELFVGADRQRGVEHSLWASVVTAGGLAIMALGYLQSPLVGLFLAYLAYTSYQELQSLRR
jgi:Zn-dependent protease